MSDLEKLKAFYDGLSNKDTPIAKATLKLIKRLTPKSTKSAAMTYRSKSPSKKGGKRRKTNKKCRCKNKTKSKK
mgnify:CR=1 FL=1|tara:strand:- start:3980 stop:4201 length:222 start_codon:yes stop_codon:yes gene_type:complete